MIHGEKYRQSPTCTWGPCGPSTGQCNQDSSQLSTITPRWLTHLLQWIPVEAGIYRLNRVNNTDDIQVACTQRDEATLPQTFVDYDPEPREYF